MTDSAALAQPLARRAAAHLARADGQEDLCFAMWYPSAGRTRFTGLIHELVLPREGDRELHGNVSYQPQFFRRALTEAMKAGAGLALMHSHPAKGWQDMSDDDVDAECDNAAAVLVATGLPFMGLTYATKDGAWSARFWRKTAPRVYTRSDCESVRIVGEALSVTWHPALRPPPQPRVELQRTLDAWGHAAQSDLARLQIGIIGLGSVGSVVAEGVARMGIERITLLDHDRIERLNLDRVLHATAQDAAERRPKVEVAVRAARESATSTSFSPVAHQLSICEDDGYKLALDCDVLFSCVDRPWPRSVLNFIAYSHLIPVIDGGIAISRTPTGRMRSAEWRAHVVGPAQQCLVCLGQYEPGLVEAERQGLLDNASYIDQLERDHPLRTNQNVFVFGLNAAGLELLQLVLLTIAPGGIATRGALEMRFPACDIKTSGVPCHENCGFPALIALGDSGGHPGVGRHAVAEQARA